MFWNQREQPASVERQLRVNLRQGHAPCSPTSSTACSAAISMASGVSSDRRRSSRSPHAGCCVVENNTIQNANNVGAAASSSTAATPTIARPPGPGNTPNSSRSRITVFGGTSGGQYVEVVAPQNGGLDETAAQLRHRAKSLRRHLRRAGRHAALASAVNDNVARQRVLHAGQRHSTYAILGAQLAQRGSRYSPR